MISVLKTVSEILWYFTLGDSISIVIGNASIPKFEIKDLTEPIEIKWDLSYKYNDENTKNVSMKMLT